MTVDIGEMGCFLTLYISCVDIGVSRDVLSDLSVGSSLEFLVMFEYCSILIAPERRLLKSSLLPPYYIMKILSGFDFILKISKHSYFSKIYGQRKDRKDRVRIKFKRVKG